MCGLAGIFELTPSLRSDLRPQVEKAIERLHHRGPDSNGTFFAPGIFMGHTRLSVIDTSPAASQPFTDSSGRYTLIYNGEIYNYRELREKLEKKSITFSSDSDTEVLLHWMIHYGQKGIKDLQGFFAFAFFDRLEHSLLLVRDRFGIKPLLWQLRDRTLTFGSEMKAMLAMGVPKELDKASLELYLQLNYIPAPWSIFQNVNKLLPGHYISIKDGKYDIIKYYEITDNPGEAGQSIPEYEEAKKLLKQKLEQAVLKRMVSDVPLGCFLSGGVDSSIITAIAAKQTPHLNTFSIGFRDEPMFDETRYSRMVAKMHGTNHTEFSLATTDLLDCLGQVMDHIDEPFADSSALAVYILSRETRKKVTVALSGDGADELFAGYNKHMAELKVTQGGFATGALKRLYPILKFIPQSRHNSLANKIRQYYRFGSAAGLTPASRYWQWACIASYSQTASLLLHNSGNDESEKRRSYLLRHFTPESGIKEVLLTDMSLVLPNDMLTKVDMMSMTNSLEVRVPFLDHELVDWVFTLPGNYKIDNRCRKKILRDAFRDSLPPEIFTRNKQGFEVPLLRWFQKELKSMITDNLLADDFIRDQKLFDPFQISLLKSKLFSSNPGDSASRIWALMVFQHWYKSVMQY